MQTGTNNVNWNGTDDNGKHVSPGVYIYELETDFSISSKKLLFFPSK